MSLFQDLKNKMNADRDFKILIYAIILVLVVAFVGSCSKIVVKEFAPRKQKMFLV